ncbi:MULTISPECIES: sugar transferase [Alphaproteobacteria]|uniref:sugar transferase n=1 Tax=Alphaproteobacteria TaxID=28211 RepID=UPI003171BD31
MANETVSYSADGQGRKALKLVGYSVWDSTGPDAARSRSKRGYPTFIINTALKKMLDLTGAAAALILLFPLMVAISIAIKLTSRGPVFFRQQRLGLNGTLFTVLKFRSMRTEQCDVSGVAQTIANDPRLTPIGAFLRKSNFDELPQLINVLKGEMSLVGPRPHVPGMLAAGVPYEEFDPRYPDRHSVLPGITGLAQANGFRGDTRKAYAAHMRLEHDLAYIRRQSFLLDLRILVATLVREFFKGSGY